MISINLVAVLIFASSIIQNAVSSDEQQVVKDAAARVHGDGDQRASNVLANDPFQRRENMGKIWNWTFGGAGATNDESKIKLEKERASPSKRPASVDEDGDSNASTSGFKKSFLRKAHLSDETKPSPSVPLRNLEKLRNGMHRNGKAPSIVERESDFDDFSNSFDSRDLSFDDDDDDDSQSSGSSQFDDDDYDLSDNEYFGRPPQPSRIGVHQKYPASFSASKAQVSHPSSLPPTGPIPIQRPAMQVRSVGMQPRSLQMRGSPAKRGRGRGRGPDDGKNSVGM